MPGCEVACPVKAQRGQRIDLVIDLSNSALKRIEQF